MADAAPRRLRLGCVGGGEGLIGKVHANGARLSNQWDVVAGALSSRPEVARKAGRAWRLPEDRIYATYEEMALGESRRDDGIDAVAIVVPNHLHVPVARHFLSHGIDVMCEKPLSRTLEEAEALGREFGRADLVFGLAHVYTSYAMVRQAREMVLSGAIGELRQFHLEYFQDWAVALEPVDGSKAVPWRLDAARGGDSFTLADIGTHAAQMAEYVAGRPLSRLRADLHVAGSPKPLEDTAFIQARLAGDIPGTIMVSQAFSGSQCALSFRFVGSRASLRWHQEQPDFLDICEVGAPPRRLWRGHGGGMSPSLERLVRMPRGHPEALSDAWANLYLDFGLAVARRRYGDGDFLSDWPSDETVYFPTLDEGVRGMRFISACLSSQRDGGWVDL